jgi:hypothetical protein
MKAAGMSLGGLAMVLIACGLGLVLIVAPTTGASIGGQGAALSAEEVAAGGQLRPDAPVPEQYLNLVLAAGQVCPEIGPAHIAAQIEVESGWNPNAYADSGQVPAHGIAQFTMPTWATWGGDYDVQVTDTAGGQRLSIVGGDDPGDPYNPANAIIAQAHLMCDLHQWAEQQLAAGALAGADALDLAWAAYFCGRGCILSHGGIPGSGLAAEYPGKVRAALSRYAAVGHVGVDGWVHPLPGGVRTSGYGMRTLGGRTYFHRGVDWAAPEGTPIHAAAAGVVIAAHCTSPRCDIPGSLQMPGSGLVVTIDHGQGIATLYAHASALAVTAGQSVQAGEVIAWVGSTGNSTGNHLHWQVHIGHPPVDSTTTTDPETFLRSVGIEP